MKIKVSTASGPVLDWMVATAASIPIIQRKNGEIYTASYPKIGKGVYSPNTGPASKIWFDAPLNTTNANPTLPRMGTTVTMAPDKLWINKKGQITLDPRVVYREGDPVIEVRTRYTHGMTGQGPFYYITTTYPCTQVPATAKDKKELLRNMATLHAMTLGHDYKLRSKL